MKGQKLQKQLHTPENRWEILAGFFIKIMGMITVAAVIAITFYLLYKGMPFFLKVGIFEMLLGTDWEPLQEIPRYGILYMIEATLFGSIGAMALAMPVGVFTAAFLVEMSPKWFSDILEPIVELLAGIPSVIYGMLGLTMVTPVLYQLEMAWYKEKNPVHMPSGGANLTAAILILAVMILPTIIVTGKTAIEAVPKEIVNGSKALGATKVQTIFGVTLKSAKSGLMTAGLLGLGRVLGETMAVSFVAGGKVNAPFPFASVRFLTMALAGEMGYAQGMHREALFAIGFILYLTIMILLGGVHAFRRKEY